MNQLYNLFFVLFCFFSFFFTKHTFIEIDEMKYKIMKKTNTRTKEMHAQLQKILLLREKFY